MVAKPLRLSLWVYLEDPLKWGIFRFSILSLKKLFVARWEWRAIDLSKSLNHERFHIVEECYERWVTFTWQEKETISFQVTSKKKRNHEWGVGEEIDGNNRYKAILTVKDF